MRAGGRWELQHRKTKDCSCYVARRLHHHKSLVNQTHRHTTEIKAVFLGDSITEGWAFTGHTVWNEHYANRGAFNYGKFGHICTSNTTYNDRLIN